MHVIFLGYNIVWALLQDYLTLLHTNSKSADQPAHPHSLDSAFVILSLDSIIDIYLYMYNFNILASLCMRADWFENDLVANTKGRFSHNNAYL